MEPRPISTISSGSTSRRWSPISRRPMTKRRPARRRRSRRNSSSPSRAGTGRSPAPTRIRPKSAPRNRCSRPNCRSCPKTGDDPAACLSGYVVGPGGHELRMIQRQIDAGDDGRYLVQVAANADVDPGPGSRSFEYALAATFLTLALALIGSTALAVRFGLRPLRVLREGVAAIRRGEAERIAGEFPQDVAPLATEVNQLTRRQPRDRRARAHPGRQSRPCAQDAAQRAR